MFLLLKMIHFFCLLAGGAASIGNMVLLLQIERNPGPPPPMVPKAMGIIANMGLGALVLLWLTGILMVLLGPGAAGLGWAFHMKRLGAAAAMGLVLYMTMLRRRADASGKPPNLARMKALGRATFAAVSVAIIFAVLSFN